MASINEVKSCKSKRRFKTDFDAQSALKKINPGRGLGKPARSYKCPVCGGYHLTSSRKAR